MVSTEYARYLLLCILCDMVVEIYTGAIKKEAPYVKLNREHCEHHHEKETTKGSIVKKSKYTVSTLQRDMSKKMISVDRSGEEGA